MVILDTLYDRLISVTMGVLLLMPIEDLYVFCFPYLGYCPPKQISTANIFEKIKKQILSSCVHTFKTHTLTKG